MIDIRFIQSMLARNKQIIAALEEAERDYAFLSDYKYVSKCKAQIAKLAAIQVALKAEISHQTWLMRGGAGAYRRNKKHGMNDPRYTAFIQSCKD